MSKDSAINGGIVFMDKKEVVDKLKKYSSLVNEKIKTKKIILYGSYAKGNWRDESDIDVAIVVDSVEGDFLENEILLYKLRRNVDCKIEPILIEEDKDDSGFLEEIIKYGEVVYSR